MQWYKGRTLACQSRAGLARGGRIHLPLPCSSITYIIIPMSKKYSVYIHIPFCRTRCFYCDFNTFAGKERLIPGYIGALCSEIRRQKEYDSGPVHSVYFGGGTPSHLNTADIRSILAAVKDTFTLTDDAEITFECNPCDVTEEYAEGLAQTGISRISLGMQSANAEELKRMGRRHTPEQTISAVRILQRAGFRNISLDLIYGYPGQTPESWQHSLETAAGLNVQHISMYALGVGEGSALARQLKMGKLVLPDDDLTVSMYETAADFLAGRGFCHYEISNWAAGAEYESRHNKQYWFVDPYYGFGAGAHGCIGGNRIQNTGLISGYIDAVNNSDARFPAAAEIIPQDRHTEMQDVMMLGLRMLNEGITEERFRERFGTDMAAVFRRELRHLEQKNLVHRSDDGRLLLNPDKVMVANQAFIEFVD
ncbi:MAG: radical SAM family heme chaperone HemW [Anaerolineaceae bacterium]|nr:radical SAM family heme chaperone HemW [Anaerolineaceae bacterium]